MARVWGLVASFQSLLLNQETPTVDLVTPFSFFGQYQMVVVRINKNKPMHTVRSIVEGSRAKKIQDYDYMAKTAKSAV